jgi:predicted SnoaL-like aldol condensation-catalyzing enzyme
MYWHYITFLAEAISTLSTATAMTYCPPRPASLFEQRVIFDAFVEAFYVEGNVTGAFTQYVALDYIQHNPFILSGRAAAIAALSVPGPATTLTIVHQLYDGNIGSVHHKDVAAGSPLVAVADYYRFDGSCIMEHWDVTQSLPANATNPLALF